MILYYKIKSVSEVALKTLKYLVSLGLGTYETEYAVSVHSHKTNVNKWLNR